MQEVRLGHPAFFGDAVEGGGVEAPQVDQLLGLLQNQRADGRIGFSSHGID